MLHQPSAIPSSSLRATYTQTLTEAQYRSWPPLGVYPTGLVEELTDALARGEGVLIAGASGSGKSTLQLEALRELSTRSEVVYVDKAQWTKMSRRATGNIVVVDDVELIPAKYDVLGYHELRTCDHRARSERGEPTICDAHIVPLLTSAARAGAGTITTIPIGASPQDTLGWINDCFPEFMARASLAVIIDRRWPVFTYTVWDLTHPSAARPSA